VGEPVPSAEGATHRRSRLLIHRGGHRDVRPALWTCQWRGRFSRPYPLTIGWHRSRSVHSGTAAESNTGAEVRIRYMPPLALLIAVVTYNSADVIEICLRSLAAAVEGVDSRLVVVDNGSSDDTLQRVRGVSPSARILQTGGNVGYAAALNCAMKAVPEWDAVLVLNPDVTPRPGSIAALARAMEDLRAGIVVPQLLDPDGHVACSLRRTPSLLTGIGEAFLGSGLSRRFGWSEVITDPGRYGVQGTTDWATGAAVMIDRRCVEVVGRWDESFLLYGEETDFMLRAADAGFATWFVPTAVMTHRGGESGSSSFLWGLLMANKVRLYSMRHRPAAAAVYRIVLLVGESVRAAAGRRRSRAALRLLARPSSRPTRLPG